MTILVKGQCISLMSITQFMSAETKGTKRPRSIVVLSLWLTDVDDSGGSRGGIGVPTASPTALTNVLHIVMSH